MRGLDLTPPIWALCDATPATFGICGSRGKKSSFVKRKFAAFQCSKRLLLMKLGTITTTTASKAEEAEETAWVPHSNVDVGRSCEVGSVSVIMARRFGVDNGVEGASVEV